MFQKLVKITRHFCQKLRENITPGNWLKIPEIMEFCSLETGNRVNIFVKNIIFSHLMSANDFWSTALKALSIIFLIKG